MDDTLKTKLKELGLTDEQVESLEKAGAKTEADLALLTADDIKSATDCNIVTIRKIVAAFAPTAPVADPSAEIGEDEKPTTAQVNGLAASLGVDPSIFMMMFAGGGAAMGSEMDISGMIPIPGIVDGYNPKVRNMFLMIMGQLERRLGVPIVVINTDGSVNKGLTVEYIEGLEEGRDPADNNIYFDNAGVPYEVIKVGVDAQSIYDADPLEPTKALQKNGMGIGRINWHNVPLEVRQVAYYAVKVGEIVPSNDAHLTWLRDHIGPDTKRLSFHGQAPKAIAEFNEAARTGSLPMLRVMLSRGPRRQEMMPRRRAGIGRDLREEIRE